MPLVTLIHYAHTLAKSFDLRTNCQEYDLAKKKNAQIYIPLTICPKKNRFQEKQGKVKENRAIQQYQSQETKGFSYCPKHYPWGNIIHFRV